MDGACVEATHRRYFLGNPGGVCPAGNEILEEHACQVAKEALSVKASGGKTMKLPQAPKGCSVRVGGIGKEDLVWNGLNAGEGRPFLTPLCKSEGTHRCSPTGFLNGPGEVAGCCTPMEPCPEFVGHCRTSNDCEEGLVCSTVKSGKSYGYNNAVNVCVRPVAERPMHFSEHGVGKCRPKEGKEMGHRYYGGIGDEACAKKCLEYTNGGCGGYSVSKYGNCLLWIAPSENLRGGGQNWGDAYCIIMGEASAIYSIDLLGAVATQSESNHGGVPQRAIDGNKNRSWRGSSCTHTDGAGLNWWQVDMGVEAMVTEVKIWNRSDCCSDRIRGAQVMVGDGKTWTNCGSPLPNQGVVNVDCDEAINGRFVRITNNNKILTLCEVEVYAEEKFATREPIQTPEPTAAPTESPTPKPTASPTPSPTAKPTASPTGQPTPAPTAEPTEPPVSFMPPSLPPVAPIEEMISTTATTVEERIIESELKELQRELDNGEPLNEIILRDVEDRMDLQQETETVKTFHNVECGFQSCKERPRCESDDALHEVACCSDKYIKKWNKKRGCSIWADTELKAPGGGKVRECHRELTYEQAEALCKFNKARLCTRSELLAGCNKKTGCSFDNDLVWTKTECTGTTQTSERRLYTTLFSAPSVDLYQY